MEKKSGKGKITLKISAGLVAAGAVAAAGYYFYGSEKAKKHRKIASKWAANMKKEVLQEAKKLEDVSSKTIAVVVDRVAKTYRADRTTDAADLKRAATELKTNWEKLQREAKRAVKKKIS